VPTVPLLTIVLPVYGVAGYLRECLDSIVSQSFADFEVIAVDDCSPDNSGDILDEYADRDSRIRVIHLDRNVGLGPARNLGLDEATGRYVWFVDSDDWIASGAFKAIADKLAETSPDLLLIDHSREYLSGTSKRSPLRVKFRPSAERTEPFPAVADPRVLRPLHTAWSRVIERDYLRRLGVRFEAAWYEDVSFIFPVTAAAERIAVLYRVCYYYRARRQGSITKSHGDGRHFEMFDQYRLVFQALDRLGVNDPGIRVRMFDRMLLHYRWVLNESGRIPKDRRHEFFNRMSADWWHYRPKEHPAPAGLEGVRQRLTAQRRWHAYNAAHFGRRLQRREGQWLVKVGDEAQRFSRRAAGKAKRLGMLAYYAEQRRAPLDENLAAYAAYWYRGVRCSPAAIYRKAAELAPDVKGVWIVKAARANEVPPGMPYVVEGTPGYFRLLARAKYLVNNVNFPDHFVKREGQVYLQTHHGTPLKVMGMDQYKYPIGAAGTDLAAQLRRSDAWDLSITTSAFNTEVWQRAYPCKHETLEYGYPRNDRLVTATDAEIAEVRERLGLRPDEKTVLYAPTHREYQAGYQPLLDIEELADRLGYQYRVLARPHYYYDKMRKRVGASEHPRVLDVSQHPDVEALYLASDLLITDYSSMMFDYAYLDRPIVIFAPDWDTYRRTRGVTFDLMAQPPGTVAVTFDELIDAFVSGEADSEASAKTRADFRARFCPHMDGRSSERTVQRLFLGESSP
jgi:CDP-glycerol glycerophosphotransferase